MKVEVLQEVKDYRVCALRLCLIAARHAIKFRGELMWKQFRHSALHQHAIAKALENVGEAAKKVSDEIKAAYPGVPWVLIMSRRNRIVHEYFRLGSPQGMGSNNSRCTELDH